jgi:hypothetical protein
MEILRVVLYSMLSKSKLEKINNTLYAFWHLNKYAHEIWKNYTIDANVLFVNSLRTEYFLERKSQKTHLSPEN